MMPMKKMIRKTVTMIKNIFLWCRPHAYLGWLQRFLFLSANFLSLSKWISKQDRNIFNDFFRLRRDYGKRYLLYEHVINTVLRKEEPFDYIEFGVSGGDSIRWWAENITHPLARFYGFDTFEGLPENWGTYRKGDMNSAVPQINDDRVVFIRGLFQETLPSFLRNEYVSGRRKVIHLDEIGRAHV